MRFRWCACAVVLQAVVLAAACLPAAARAQEVVDIEEALREARVHNARLPVAAFDTSMAEAGVREASGRLWPSVGVGGHLHGGAPSRYASGDGRLQLLLDVPLYAGGALRADVRRARADRAVTSARYRVAVRDVDLEVRLRFTQALALQDEIALRRRGLERLGRYVDLIGARQRSGEPVTGDLLKARVRRERQQADLEVARRGFADAMLELEDLLGREPGDSLVLAPLPEPAPPGAAGERPWEEAPDVRAAVSAEKSAAASIDAVRADRRPHLDLALNAGTEPVIGGSFEAPLNTGRGSGAEVTLTLAWPLWDNGVYSGRLQAAQLASRKAQAESEVARRQARLGWTRARAELDHLYREIGVRRRAVPSAEDAWLQMESLYRGGDATSLEVLDAFDEWVQAGLDALGATLEYRAAAARALRWGGS